MNKIITLLMVLFLTSIAQAEVRQYKLSYSGNLTAGTTENAPTTCERNLDGTLTASDCGIDVTGATSINVQLDTTDTNNAATAVVDLNFLYGSDTVSHECIGSLADNKKKTCLVTLTAASISFTTDCATAACRPIIWVNIER